MNYAQAAREIAENYRMRIYAYEARELELLRSNEELRSCETKMRDLILREVKGEKIDKKALDALKKQNAEIRRKLGLIPPAPACAKCGDKGIVDGKYCECAVALSSRSADGEAGIPLHDFSKVDYSVYGEAQELYKKLFSDVEKICTKYPESKKRTVVISGSTGNGKTYLAGCAAKKMLERGFSVVAETAFSVNHRCLKYHTSFDENRAEYLSPLLDCSLLVIDDLGTESLLKNVTVEYLYQIVNERTLSGKLTMITTNLSPDQILTRYGERIYSRLFDKSLSYYTHLKGKDLRSAK